MDQARDKLEAELRQQLDFGQGLRCMPQRKRVVIQQVENGYLVSLIEPASMSSSNMYIAYQAYDVEGIIKDLLAEEKKESPDLTALDERNN